MASYRRRKAQHRTVLMNRRSKKTKPPAKRKPLRKKGGYQRKLEQREREIADLKKQLAERSAAPASEAKQESTPPASTFDQTKPKPKMDEFDSIEEFTEALTDWKADERDFKRNIEAQQKQVLDAWNARRQAAQEAHADYEKVLSAASDVMLSPAHQRLFLESEAGAELAYQLAKDPSELKQFAAMDPLKAARLFGKLEAQFSSDSSDTTETRTSKAPKPIRPIGGRNAGSSLPDLSKVSLGDYRRLRESGRLR
jgi:hypothetical protein